MRGFSSARWATACRAMLRQRAANSLAARLRSQSGQLCLPRCPVILFFGLYRGKHHYEIYFEHFADEITLNRDRRAEDIQLWMQRYAERLEHYTRLAPYNWFNFYPFWD